MGPAARAYHGFHQAFRASCLVDGYQCRVGQIHSAAIGPDGGEKQTHNGALLHQFLLSWNLCLPCTLGKHRGEHHTWQSPLSTSSRVDYVAVPGSWLEHVDSTCVDRHFEFGQVRSDHWLTMLRVGWSQRHASTDAVQASFRPGQPDPLLASQWVQGLASMPPIAWSEMWIRMLSCSLVAIGL